MKKIILFLSLAVFIAAVIVNIQYAQSGYGMNFLNLAHTEALAQGEGEGGTAVKDDCYELIDIGDKLNAAYVLCDGTEDFPYPVCPTTYTPAAMVLLNFYCVRIVN